MTAVFNLATLRSPRVQRQRYARGALLLQILALSLLSGGCPGTPSEPKVPPKVVRSTERGDTREGGMSIERAWLADIPAPASHARS